MLRTTLALAIVGLPLVVGLFPTADTHAAQLLAGVAKVDITSVGTRPAHDRLHARALVLSNGTSRVAVVTLDVVAIGEIKPIGNDFLGNLRSQLKEELHIKPENVLVNASHCHGAVCSDVQQRTIKAIRIAAAQMVPVMIGVGRGHEDRIMVNRRLRLRSGKTLDIRRAYSLPPDDEVASVGPVDTEIGVLRLDREDGRPLATIFNFACHPIQGAPDGGNTADIAGHACRVIEDNLGGDAVALFLQGCAGDINPVWYKDVNHPHDAEPLGSRLGLSTLRVLRDIHSKKDGRLDIINQRIELPLADYTQPIHDLEAEQAKLVQSLRGTSLNLKTFVPLMVKYNISGAYPTYYSHLYKHEQSLGRTDLATLDAENRENLTQYIHNIHIMEQLTRLQVNLTLLRKHQANYASAPKKTVTVEMLGLRIGALVLITFPGELTVQIGLDIKKHSPHDFTFVVGYTNGYIYYAPTAEQLRNVGHAQEDSDCILAPAWQALFENQAADMLRKL